MTSTLTLLLPGIAFAAGLYARDVSQRYCDVQTGHRLRNGGETGGASGFYESVLHAVTPSAGDVVSPLESAQGDFDERLYCERDRFRVDDQLVSRGAIWYVDGSVSESGDGASWQTAFKTIREAIEAAAEGDTVTVAGGTYYERVRFTGKNLILRSTDPLDPDVVEKTIIDADLWDSAVSFNGTEDATSVLAGFTIQNGAAPQGGGIWGARSEDSCYATIQNNVIRGNHADRGGGLARCHEIIKNNIIFANSSVYEGGGLYYCNGTIVRNVAAENSADQGAGLALCQAVVEDNTISDNGRSREGGGLYRCDHTIRNNRITGCSALVGGGLAYCDGLIQSNVVAQNDAEGLYECDGEIDGNIIAANSGGGIHECDGTIQNNVISRNCGKPGSGLVRCDGLIQNNTIVYNTAHSSGGAFRECTAVIRNCIIWGNRPGYLPQLYSSSQPTYSCIEDWTGGEGNISEDPKFVDPDGPDDNPDTYQDNDYRLRPDSPCIDAGFNHPDLPETDILGNPRILYSGKSFTVDMGAYEYVIARVTAGPGPEEATFTWSSLANKVYSVLHSEDLLNWRVADDSVLSQGNMTTSWIDDGSKTGAPITLVPRRFYRAAMNP